MGTPKGDGNAPHPISVALVWVRAWRKATLLCFFAALDGQRCCRAGASVVLGTADLLAQREDVGLELDLSEAFATLDHRVALAA